MSRRPNVLWIMSDQHSSRALGCYGNGVVRTPRLDGLAAEGMQFDRAYCSYPVCVPARFTMLTGRYPHHHGAVGNRTPLPLRERTAAHHFGHAGYATAFLGKMHPVDGQTHGFDYYVDFGHYYDYLGPKTEVFTRGMGANDSGSGSPWLTIYQRGDRSPWVGRDDPRRHETLELGEVLAEEDQFESFIARETIRFLETYRDEPTFVVASFLKPHNPFAPPPEYAAMYRPEDMVAPTWPAETLERVPAQARFRTAPGAGGPEGEAWAKKFLAAYYGNVTHLDACVGRLLDAVGGLGLAENTIVLYTTDHGEMLYEHGLRGKFNFFEPSARNPLLVRWPGVVPAGSRTAALTDQADFVPTLLEACEIGEAPRSQPRDGRSFAHVLRDPRSAGKEFAFGEYALPRRSFYMRRSARWKYVYYTEGGEELYEPEVDPGELRNLAAEEEYGEVVAAEREALLGYLREQGAPLAAGAARDAVGTGGAER
ncbi:MAG TPA: sulfatase-like hydrolase/transferase [Chloroflexota bacterium]|nr:sulfatase-like hydrolase/transferase [Chloroflexota bacterium]